VVLKAVLSGPEHEGLGEHEAQQMSLFAEDRAVAGRDLRQVRLHFVDDGAAVAASGVSFGLGQEPS